ncbi:MAG: bifunctional oligoribonuclease/PAP phosphatase NrnA [Solobacterium sp.]|nr:bifunctional oligoribonuclease/PAP phosphatase NrnA [Solobacterium sp.]
MEFGSLLEEIVRHDIITIFRHEHPDCDAVGSQFGLKQWINENWPAKKVYALGYESCSQAEWPASDIVSDDTIRKSLAIVVDTANAARVDDSRFQTAVRVIKIDHHPNREHFGSDEYVYENAAAASEILTRFFRDCTGQKMSLLTAEYLYRGILTDTLCFKTNNTTSHTLAMASFLAGFGIDIPEINRELFDQSLDEFRFAAWVRTHIRMKGSHLAYIVITLEDLKTWNIDAGRARNFITEIGQVREFLVWAVFTQKELDGNLVYDGSLRSKEIAVNEVAEHFNGGGHRNAAGVKNLTGESLNSLIESLCSKIE